MLKHLIKRGRLMPNKDANIALAEIAFNLDTSKLIVGIGDGKYKDVADIVVKDRETGILYMEVPEGMMPLCILDPNR